MSEFLLLGLIGAAVAAAALGIASAAGGAANRRLRGRLAALSEDTDAEPWVNALRARHLRQLSPLERRLESLAAVQRLAPFLEQAGWSGPAYRVLGLSLALAAAGALGAAVFGSHAVIMLAAALAAGAMPWLKAVQDRTTRLARFEEQLPDALDLMSRSLLAGNPLLESFKFVSEEMKPPIAVDFGRAWSNVNYGISVKDSLADMLLRTPNLSLRALATAILVQRETGGNLAEILQKITHVLRSRARFQRRLRTLTAEGRMSGWVLGLLPFGMAGLLAVTSPGYLPILFESASGQKLLMTSAVLMVIGVAWISRVVRVRI